MTRSSESRKRVVVGIDRHGQSGAALEWAAAAAARRGADLEVVHAWTPPHVVSPVGIPGPAQDLGPFEADAKRCLDDAIDSIPFSARRSVPRISPISVVERASVALIDTSVGAELLVVGTRKRGALTGLLGSVSHQCVHHAACPVTVVPPGWPSRALERIVVGVDGSEASAAALRWAFDEARSSDAAVTVVHAWNTPYPVEPWGVVVTPTDRDAFHEGARALAELMVDSIVAEGAVRPTDLQIMPVEDAAGPGLVHAATEVDADLLVVGSRGRGGFAALLVGSVSLHCLHTARCPVAVIRPAV